jgi:hypothetical protein
MAKKKTPGESSGRWERKSLTPDELDQMAGVIENAAQQLRTSARDMRALKIDSVVLAIGNWELAVRKIDTWIGNQLVSRVLQKAALMGGRLKLVEFDIEPNKKKGK